MAERVTLQDIADACNVSRNTVSKAINNTGVLAPETRDRILRKAVELGYKQFSYISFSSSEKGGEKVSATVPVLQMPEPLERSAGTKNMVAVFSSIFLGNTHFSFAMLNKIQEEMSGYGYSLALHHISEEDLKNKTFPNTFRKEQTAAIICLEVFDSAYVKRVTELDIPVLFVDYPVDLEKIGTKTDRLMMENRMNIHLLVNEMVKRGKTKIGFVGEQFHCMSFFERYLGVRDALTFLGIPFEEKYSILGTQSCILYPSPDIHKKGIEEKLRKMEELPEVFVCANDFVAADVYMALQKMGIRIPEDIWICGFDDSFESRIITPPLTTIRIHSESMGHTAVQLLLSRIKNPDLGYRTVYTETTIIYRESTGDIYDKSDIARM